MNILITGANGFIGKNLSCTLQNIKDKKDKFHSDIDIDEIYLFETDSDPSLLDDYCKKADFVFNLAGVNRPKDESDFKKGNTDFALLLLEALKKNGNTCPVMLSSSSHAENECSEYGKSKKEAEDLFFSYGEETKARVLVYRFPNVFGKWCRPNYNSAVATFCYNIARDLPITVNDESTSLTLVYIDDLIEELLCALKGKEHRKAVNEKDFCFVPVSHTATLGEIVKLLKAFALQRETLLMPSIPEGSFPKKLYSTFLSYLPKEKVSFVPKTHFDERGSFTELLKSENAGQVSVNVIKPLVTKGEHWHHSKWEFFIVLSGEGVIKQRQIGTEKVIEHRVSGEKIEVVHILPGFTHSIKNLSDKNDMVVLMWANENFDENKPDTYFEVTDK